MSDDSENEVNYTENYQNDAYYKKYKLLLERCEFIQKSNERLVFRLQQVKTIIKRRYVQIDILKERLNEHYNEDWTEIPREEYNFDEEDLDVKPSKLIKVEKVEEEDVKPKIVKKPTKRKSGKDKDPNAPKRPSNPFFQFCQDQRQNLMEQLSSELKPGESEPSKQELTRQLALKWKSMSVNDKKMYVDMYERSKEKYAVELSEYKNKK